MSVQLRGLHTPGSIVAAAFCFGLGACSPNGELGSRACAGLPAPAVAPPAAVLFRADSFATGLAARSLQDGPTDSASDALLQSYVMHAGSGQRAELFASLVLSAARHPEHSELFTWLIGRAAQDSLAARRITELMAIPPDADEQRWRTPIAVAALVLHRTPPQPDRVPYYRYAYCRLVRLAADASQPESPESLALDLGMPSVVVPSRLLEELWKTGREEERVFVRAALDEAPARLRNRIREDLEARLSNRRD
jgi:hypothetical protein